MIPTPSSEQIQFLAKSSCLHVFIIFHGGGTEKSDGDDQIHGTDFAVDFFFEIKAFH